MAKLVESEVIGLAVKPSQPRHRHRTIGSVEAQLVTVFDSRLVGSELKVEVADDRVVVQAAKYMTALRRQAAAGPTY